MKSTQSRFIALDAFRGLAIALMILVNTPGDWGSVYAPLLHSNWHGLTPTDIVFPCFLFIVGASIYFAFAPRGFSLCRASVAKVIKRAMLMFTIGLSLNAYNMVLLDTDSIRVMGVLQRISICYLFGALLVLSCRIATVYCVSVFVLIAYFLVFMVFGGDSPFALEGNIVAFVDRSILGEPHMWKINGIAFEPEGILSTFPATITMLLGFEAARRLTSLRDSYAALRYLIISGACLLFIGYVVSALMPINKNIWSVSFVLISGGVALWVLATCVLFSDVLKFSVISEPLRIYGTNPLLIYCLSWLLATGLLGINLDILGFQDLRVSIQRCGNYSYPSCSRNLRRYFLLPPMFYFFGCSHYCSIGVVCF